MNTYHTLYTVHNLPRPPCCPQAGGAFPVTVLFKPRASMLEQCARFLVDAERQIFEIPMKLNVPDQRLPVSFTLRAQVRDCRV